MAVSDLRTEHDVAQDHWDHSTLRFIAPHLRQAQEWIRIATGFFTVAGYDLVRPHLMGKRVHILVGYDEASRERLRAKLIDDIMSHLCLWDAENRREAVLDLAGKLQRGELRIIEQGISEVIDARTRKKDHAKVYIIDDDNVLLGSTNLTVNGLRRNAESAGSIRDPERVAFWVKRFRDYWNAPDTYDLTEALLEALLAWLDFRPPYDVYLKTVQALIPEDDTQAPRDSYKMPVRYQLVVIERVLRQLRKWRGAMLVASTGLGKTIMATHAAYRLSQEGRIRNVVVFAPVAVQLDWEEAMDSAGLNCTIITRNLLDRGGGRRGRKMRRMLRTLDRVDDQYLIVVDESQYFKNRLRAKDGKPRYSFRRLAETVRQKHAYIVLLTATPFAKGVRDLNNQLHLLPHSAEPTYCNAEGQFTIPGMRDDEINPCAWKVREAEGFFEEFIDLPVSTVISTSQVAKNFAEHVDGGDYVSFGDEKRWIPEIAIRRIKVPVPLERAMSAAIRADYFKHQMFSFQHRGVWQRSETTIQKEAEIAWTSSPLALEDVLEKTISGDYEVDFVKSDDQRAEVLAPILERLKAISYQDDEKFMALCHYIRRFHHEGKKVVVFTERLATAVYLEQGLAQEIPYLHLANAVQQTEGDPELKDFEEVLELLLDFAPEANADKIHDDHCPKAYDVFLTTDAYGAGVNLQDASVVISYDLAWTPDTLIQRAGRILRFWRHPRRVHLYVFVSDFRKDSEGMRQTNGINRRLESLTRRSQHAEKFSELPVFSEEKAAEYTSLGDLSSVTIADLGLADISEIEEFTGVSRFLHHITELNENVDYADSIPDDISSTMSYGQSEARLFLLLKCKNQYQWVLYNLETEEHETLPEDDLLDLICCTRETPIANVPPDTVERDAQSYRKRWIQEQGIETSAQVERICALYLAPDDKQDEFAPMLRKQMEAEL